LSSLYSSICTNPRVLQWFVQLDAVRRASFSRPLWESRCPRDKGSVLRRAARVKGFSSPAEASARIELLLRRGSSRDGASPQTPALEVRLETRFVRRAGSRYRRRAAAKLQRFLFVGHGCMSSAIAPGYSVQAHTALRCAQVCALILACLHGARDHNVEPCT
jgi:hypothetical protein